ncbi:VTT domain-containing protein [bacterium]|nr:VTT domain-containing protein [bacterium]
MHIFTDYVQPLTAWLYTHPEWALLITFIISFAESLAIIGSLIPGSVTMTAIGILAGSGVMRIDLTFCAAVLGAIAGDSASYLIGYTFSDRLAHIWPFRRYPNWLKYGEDYFNRHGGKSVLIGRFAGPLRSIIPVIAGIMRMPRLHFFLANITSAIGWAILYILPGMLIGAASNELSPESATRLFGFILLLLAVIWLASQGIKWLFVRIKQLLLIKLEAFWIWSEQKTLLAPILNRLTPQHEKTHYSTIVLTALFLIFLSMSFVLIVLTIQNTYFSEVNQAVFYFLQSLRTHAFDNFFIVVSLLISPSSLIGLIISLILVTALYQNWRLLCYWISIVLSSVIVALLLNSIQHAIKSTVLTIDLTIVASLFSFIMCYLRTPCQNRLFSTLRALLLILLVLVGFASLYLGDNWLSTVLSAYSIGLSLGLIHWILFRRREYIQSQLQRTILFSLIVLIPITCIEYDLQFKTLVKQHHLFTQQYELSHHAWWHQHKPVLPLYTTNRIGKPTGLFNIQYVGSIHKLETALNDYGWETQPNTFLYSLLMRAEKLTATKEFPLMAQLYLNKKPALTMSYQQNENESLYILRLWRSNYHLSNHPQSIIWLGSIIYPQSKETDQTPERTLFSHLLPALVGFTYTEKTLTPNAPSQNLLMIEELPD